MKNILKEIAIFVLILVAIILVLGVILYDYIPTSKVVPATIAYQTPENLKSEIQEELIEDNSQAIITYEIDKSDLKTYQNTSSYKPGKQNPFDEYQEEAPANVGSTSSGQASTGSSSNTAVSDAEYFNNNKTK